MEEISRATDNRIQMTRRGYALVTRRRGPDDLIGELYKGYGAEAERTIRILDKASSAYRPPTTSGWPSNPTGVDVLRSQDLIRTTFPTYADEVATVLHIRRAGSISAQQLGQYMLERVREAGGRLIRGKVIGIEKGQSFVLSVRDGDTGFAVGATRVVNAAGPFITDIARMLGEELPVSCVFQQKIAFEDRDSAIPRGMPFTIDLDGQEISWSAEEREILREDPTTVR